MIGLLPDNIDVRWLWKSDRSILSRANMSAMHLAFLNSNQIPLIFMILLFMYVGIRGKRFTVV